MAGKKRTRGAPPATLTGQMPVSSLDSPWWDGIIARVTGDPDLVGKVLTIEELTRVIGSYADGRSPRGKAVARRMRPVLELVSRGPNGSLGRGATYRIKGPPVHSPPVGRTDVVDETIPVASDWLQDAIERMTREK